VISLRDCQREEMITFPPKQDDMVIKSTWHPSAGPPSMKTCFRDVYERKNMSTQNAKIIVQGMLQVLRKPHAKGICHGDFYGHNILVQDGDESLRSS
jgi:serine/threonine protein kinase